jgi:hypothetical protein
MLFLAVSKTGMGTAGAYETSNETSAYLAMY